MQTRMITLLALAAIGLAMIFLLVGAFKITFLILGIVVVVCLALAAFNWRKN